MSEMVKAAGEAGVDMITDLVNKIIIEEVIPTVWELGFIVNCYKGKEDALERRNYRRLKLIDHIRKISERVVEKLIRQQVDIDELKFFMPGFCFKTVTRKLFCQKKLYFA